MSGRRNVLRDSGYARKALEKYYTPAWVTEALLRHFEARDLVINGKVIANCEGIWEPAAGNGAIRNVFEKHGWIVPASDIEPEGPHIARANFLTTHNVEPTNIVTNPPFGQSGNLAFRFCWHALRLTEKRKGRVAMLLRDDFDSAGGRQQLFKLHPAWHKKIVLTERIRWTNLPQKDAGPSGNHAWYIWDWSRDRGPATIAYEGSEP